MKQMLLAMTCVLIGLVSGCTTEKHYPAQPVVYEERPSPADTRSDTREAAREGAREGARDPYR